MRQAIYILTIFFSTVVLGQNRDVHLKNNSDDDTSLWYKWRVELCSKINLDTVHSTQDEWHFRFWTNKQVIDLWEDVQGITSGKLTSWTKEHTPYDEEPTNRIYFESQELDSNLVSRILVLIASTQIQTIPDEDSIKGWKQGFDGITYIIETADLTDYYFKTYWTPTAQDSLEEAIIVQNFADRIMEIAEAKEAWTDFATRIPYECYINGGPSVACKVLTKREKRKYREERRNYRQQTIKHKPRRRFVRI